MDADACAEVIDILKYIPVEDYNKIPKEFRNSLYQNANQKSDFRYNVALPFSEQKISAGAKRVLAYIAENYWSDIDKNTNL